MESHCVPSGPQILSQGVLGWTMSCPSISLPGPSHPNLAPCLMTPSSTLSAKIFLKFPWTTLPLPLCLEKPGWRCIPHSVMSTVPASLMYDQYKDTRLFFQKAHLQFCALCLPPWQIPTDHPGFSATVQDGIPGLFPLPLPATFAWSDSPSSPPVLYLDLTMVFITDPLMGVSDSALLSFFTCLRLISLFAFSLCSQTLICSPAAFFFYLVDCVF